MDVEQQPKSRFEPNSIAHVEWCFRDFLEDDAMMRQITPMSKIMAELSKHFPEEILVEWQRNNQELYENTNPGNI